MSTEYRLEELFDLQMGKTPLRNNPEYWDSADCKWISIGDLSKCGKYIRETKEYISEKAVSESGISLIPEKTVVMSFKLSIGKTAITAEPMYSNEAIMSFRDRHVTKLLPDYIYYMFSGRDWTAGANKAVMGKTLNKATLSAVKVKIHSFPTQREIVERLDRAKRVLALREQELQTLDALIKARFVEMFGDPVSNPKGLPLCELSKLGLLERGRSKHRPRNAPELLGGPYPLVQTGEVSSAGLYITSYSQTYSKLGLQQSRMWKAGTLCVTIAANIAQTAILAFDACFPDSVVGFTTNGQMEPIYLHYWFTFFQKILEDQAPQVAQKNINLEILSNLQVIVPEVEQQKEFISFVTQADKSKIAVQKALDETQLLFDSLMQKYFG